VFENGIAAQTQAHEQQQQQDQAQVADQEQSQQQANEQEPVAEPVPEPAAVVEEVQSAVETADVAPITNEDPSEPAPDVAPDSQQDPDADTEPAPVYALQEEEEEDDTGTPAARTPPASGSASFQFISDGLTLPNPSDPAATDASGKWAVWTRRPTDPTLAPALLFSRRSRAPRQVVQQLIGEALDDTTPPASPAPAIRAPLTAESLAQMDPDADASTPAAMAKAGLEVATDAGMTEASVDVLPPASEAATEVGFGTETQSVRSTRTSTPTSAPTPRSPLSSLTSISASPAVKSTAKIDGEVAPASESVAPASSTAAATAQGTPATSTTAPATPPVKAPPKSWASLLQGSSRSNLPTSTVVGFSIPAGLPSSSGSGSANANGTGSAALGDAVLPIAPAHRGELLNLLTRDPAGFAGWAPRIRPRGLLNQGNMCFANAVLQSLVYCPPFHRLFSDLGRLMLPGHIGPVVGQDKEKEKEKVGERRTPLVEATVQFVKEFEMKEIVAASTGTGKGKERERERAEADDDWEVSSFLPTYFYDAMKEKKRFEGMRVRLFGQHNQEEICELIVFVI
jgi:ubiquitin carboxyl-terminal hydrolase 10